MTCIVGFIEKDTVYIGGDSAGVGGYNLQIRRDVKVFKSGPFVMGFTSSFRMGQLLMSSKFKSEKQLSKQSDYDYMITTFIDSVRKLFKDNGFEKKYTDGESKGGTFLVGYKGKLYEIDDDFQVGIREENYGSVGCGSQLSMGAMYILNSDTSKTPEEKIEASLRAAERFSAGVSGPFNIVLMSKSESEKESKKLK